MRDADKSDEQLLAEFVAGRKAALGELARRHESSLLGLACGLLGGREDLARDAVQETWMRVVRFAGGFHGRSCFKTWVYRIAVNQCRDI
ncbi:MAG TPA: sigma factor, partial [Phycisphaerae bacterium]|nr:sigma factor [Phycisphaerae bacterium]